MDREAIIQTAPLIEGGLVDQEREIKKKIVKAAVVEYNGSESLSSSDLQRIISRKMNIRLADSVINKSLRELESEGTLKHIADGEYEIIEKTDVPSFENLFEEVWVEFRNEIHSSDFDRQIDYRIEKYKSALRDFFLQYYDSMISESTNLEENAGGPLIDKKFNAVLDDICNQFGFRNEEVFRQLFKKYVEKETSTLKRFLGTIYVGIVNYDLLSRGQYMDLSGGDQESKILFLDTNALIPLVCNSDPLYPLINSLCQRSKQLGYDLYYLPITASEMERVVNITQRNLSGFSPNGQSDPFNNQFIRDFKRRDDLSSPQAYKVHLGKWKQILNEKFDICEYHSDIPNSRNINKEVIKQWVKELDKLNSDGEKSVEQIKHDVELIRATTELRPEREDGPLVGPFGITNNTSLLPINNIGKAEVWEHGVLIHPQGWLNYLVAFTPAEFTDGDQEDIAKAILSISADFENGFSLDDYLDILAAKADIPEEDTDFMKEVIMETPLSDELEEAARRGDGNQVEQKGYEIISGIKEYIESESKKDEKLKKASQRVQEEVEAKKRERETKTT